MATRTRETPVPKVTPTGTPEWLRLARGASIAMAVWSVALQLLAGTVIPPVAVIGLAFLVFAVFLKGERRRLGLVLTVFATLAVVGNLPVIADELQNPESAPAFILNLFSLSAVAVAAIAGVNAFRKSATSPIKPIALAATGVFVAGTIVSLLAAAATPSDEALATDVEVTAQQVMWAPEAIVISADATGLWVDNRDGIRHTFTIPELGIDVEVPAWKARRVPIDASPGTYQIICRVPTHEDMTATLTVEG